MANAPPSVDVTDVYERLEGVTDPELDRPLTDLGFVDDVTVEGRDVTVALRLPTGMCSPVFAWMMARDAREEVQSRPGVDRVTVTLEDHLFAAEITTGVNDGREFVEVFEDAETSPEHVRRKLDWKACLAREHEVVEFLRGNEVPPREIVRLRRGDVRIEDDATVVSLRDRTLRSHREVIRSYLQKAEGFDVATEPSDRLLVDTDGDPIEEESFDRVRRRLRTSHVNKENQGHRCEQLLESRYGTG